MSACRPCFKCKRNGAADGTQLPLELSRKGVKVIVLTGIHLDWRIEGNARAARASILGDDWRRRWRRRAAPNMVKRYSPRTDQLLSTANSTPPPPVQPKRVCGFPPGPAIRVRQDIIRVRQDISA
jgi:hypothetical protein